MSPAAGAGLHPRLASNSFDLLRFWFAFTVFIVHCHTLSGEAALAWVDAWFSSDLAVKSFFVVSGLLVFMSYERSDTLRVYIEKRFRRIYPAYATVVLLCAFGLVAVSSVGASRYFGRPWLGYVGANLAFANFLQPALPGVFEHNAFDEVNGALWTLKIEVMFYAGVPLIAACFRPLGRRTVLAALLVASVLYSWGMAYLAAQTGNELYTRLGRQLPGQLAYFIAGAIVFYEITLFERFRAGLLAGGLALLAADVVVGGGALQPLWLAIAVATVGLSAIAPRFGRFGDFSYGVYILHFPIIQLMVGAGIFRRFPLAGTVLAAAVVVSGAVALWHLVEKPCLRQTSHYLPGR
jgi:peptidoglycan/LPS O-acetylase OafA/YrhL